MANKSRNNLKSNHRNWLLLRRLNDASTYAFVVTVDIEEDPDNRGSFAASIKQLPGTVTAVENSGFAAEESALKLFQDMVDNCLESNALDELLSDAVPSIMEKIDFPLDQVIKAMNAAASKLEKGGAAKTSRPDGWVGLKAA